MERSDTVKIILIALISLLISGCVTNEFKYIGILSSRISKLEKDVQNIKDSRLKQKIQDNPDDYNSYLKLKEKFEINGE